ncbi:MAG: efflux RND transporter periplasmic adaptor subunit, partial [Myxococcales bacterium]|nr:efflux RND transporter periplasmic adaptor subunit [Myxococcales bacterium]
MNAPFARRRAFVLPAAVTAFVLAALVVFRGPLVGWFTGRPAIHAEARLASDPQAGSHPDATSTGEVDHYTCSMHPSVRQAAPGTCPICGMSLVPVSKEQQEQGIVLLDEARRQLIGVRT